MYSSTCLSPSRIRRIAHEVGSASKTPALPAMEGRPIRRTSPRARRPGRPVKAGSSIPTGEPLGEPSSRGGPRSPHRPRATRSGRVGWFRGTRGTDLFMIVNILITFAFNVSVQGRNALRSKVFALNDNRDNNTRKKSPPAPSGAGGLHGRGSLPL